MVVYVALCKFDTAIDLHEVRERQQWPECHFMCHSSLPSESRLFFLFFESTAATRALLKEGSKGRFVQELTAELHPLVEWTHYKRNRWLSLSSQSAARYLADFS